MAFARHQFALAKRHGDGEATVRDHLRQALKGARSEKARAAITAQLDGPPMPRGCGPLFTVFTDISRWRGSSGMGPSPLTLHDIEAWERRFLPTGVRLPADDLDLLKRLDHASLSGS